MGFIGKNSVFGIEYIKLNNHRKYLKMIVNSNKSPKQALVIMKNPSTTVDNMQNSIKATIITGYSDKAKCHIDKSTGRVLRKLKSLNYDEVIILNLYSLYNSQPLNVNSYYYSNINNSAKLLSVNNMFISQYLKNYSGDVICAWGNANGINKKGYDNQIDFVESFFNSNYHNLFEYDSKTNSFISRNLNNKYPSHGLMWK